jgi:putative nucleotidyltransferase with HDIG domain
MDDLLFEKIIGNYHQYVHSIELGPELELKYNHSKNVATIASHIADFVLPSKSVQRLLYVAALYHDIGRYDQFLKYHTFSDKKSVDHALLGVEMIKKGNFFEGLNETDQQQLFDVIENHNKKDIIATLPANTVDVCNVLRDADKIDILRLLSAHYKTGVYDATLSLGLPDVPQYNPAIIADILGAKIADFSMMESLNDFKLLNMSWVFDLNFAISHVMVHESKVLKKIYQSISVKSPEIDTAFQLVDGICEAYLH